MATTRKRPQKQPHKGEVWTRTIGQADVRVISVRARAVHYENVDTGRSGSSAIVGFLQRFTHNKATVRRMPANVVPIERAARRAFVPPARVAEAARRGGRR